MEQSAGKARLVLGSSSPRRLELLRQIGIEPDQVIGPDIDESIIPRELPNEYCMRIALEKNAALHDKFPNDFILTADTTVAVGRRILAKAEDVKDAERMIRLLSGRAHRVYTATVLRDPSGRVMKRLSDSRVKVKPLSEQDIQKYLAANDWDGFAGAYRLQGMFAQYVIHVSGSPSGIIGLPIFETAQMLKGSGYDPAA